eukprot:16022983-Heterocapsa_arctica.AAC.1
MARASRPLDGRSYLSGCWTDRPPPKFFSNVTQNEKCFAPHLHSHVAEGRGAPDGRPVHANARPALYRCRAHGLQRGLAAPAPHRAHRAQRRLRVMIWRSLWLQPRIRRVDSPQGRHVHRVARALIVRAQNNGAPRHANGSLS